MEQINLILGDNILSLKKLQDNSIDSVVTDPPYGLSFMGKKWDISVPSVQFWKEVYRVLKPGGHVLSFGGSRTYHRMAVNIEDAGFEIRDQIMWLYGSGFPKSNDLGKSADKILGNEREIVGKQTQLCGKSKSGIGAESGCYKNGSPDSIDITKGASDFEGWGTNLKPSHEPICLARKPISEKTIALNALKWNTGGINIDGTRIKTDDDLARKNKSDDGMFAVGNGNNNTAQKLKSQGIKYPGRWPANIILDEEAGEILDEQSGKSKSSKEKGGRQVGFGNAKNSYNIKNNNAKNNTIETIPEQGYSDSGGASRFFYCAKTSVKERNLGLENSDIEEKQIEGRDKNQDLSNVPYKKRITPSKNIHPTVKPLALMKHLITLITPNNGIVLDPFMGSGSTGMAAKELGFNFIGMELNEEYFEIAKERIENYK